MSKREPLLNVRKLMDEFCEVHPLHAQLYAKQTACWVRDFYENLIDEGKLRVVEEVEMLKGHGFSFGTCSGCGILALKQHAFCPGCGNKVKL